MPTNHIVVLDNRPEGEASASNFKLITSETPTLQEGQVLVKHHYLSLDPYMRGRMNAGKNYAQPQPLGEAMIGGTVGDIESLPFVESVRQLQWELPEEDTMVVHLTLIPYLRAAKELKTKPTQHSVRMLSQEGVHPDVIVCRTERSLSQELRRKIALFCNVRQEAVIESADAETIYEVPLMMMREGLDTIVMKKLNLKSKSLVRKGLSLWSLLTLNLQIGK